MQAVVVEEGRFRVSSLPDPTPGPDDLVLRVTGCGVCGSDLKAYAAMPAGTVMGHEFCGEVVAVGRDARGTWRDGMHAAALPVFSCGTCAQCRTGHVAHCDQAALVGLGGASGAFAELVRVSSALAFAVPESLPPEAGTLVEPFAVGLHTARAAAIGDGDRVLVLGGGSVGLTTARWARELGAATVTVSDPVGVRREAAGTFGATAVIDPSQQGLGGPYDVIVDCVGKPGLLDVCAEAAAVRARIVVAGVCAEPDTYLPLIPLLKELTIGFSVYYTPEEFRTVLDAFASGAIDPMPLVSRTVGLAQVGEVIASLEQAAGDVKVVIDPRMED